MIEFGVWIVFNGKESSANFWISFSKLVDCFCLILLVVAHFPLFCEHYSNEICGFCYGFLGFMDNFQSQMVRRSFVFSNCDNFNCSLVCVSDTKVCFFLSFSHPLTFSAIWSDLLSYKVLS